MDYDRKAVVVEYEQESSLMDEYGEVLRVERKPHRKLYVGVGAWSVGGHTAAIAPRSSSAIAASLHGKCP